MSKKKMYGVVGLGIFLSIFIWNACAWAEEKIGFINLQEIMQDSNAGKKAADEFKKYYEKETQEIKAVEKELKKMQEELEKQASIMKPSTRNEKEAAYQKKLRDYQLMVNDTNEELRKRDQEMTQKLMPGIIKVVRTIAEREKYALVIDVATMPVPYYAKEKDFSQKVIEEFNKVKP